MESNEVFGNGIDKAVWINLDSEMGALAGFGIGEMLKNEFCVCQEQSCLRQYIPNNHFNVVSE